MFSVFHNFLGISVAILLSENDLFLFFLKFILNPLDSDTMITLSQFLDRDKGFSKVIRDLFTRKCNTLPLIAYIVLLWLV